MKRNFLKIRRTSTATIAACLFLTATVILSNGGEGPSMHDQSSLVVYAFSIPLSSSSLPRQFSSESSIDFSTSILYGGFGSGSGGCDRKRLSSSYFSPTSLHGGAISSPATDNNNASPSTASTITKLQSTISLILLDRIFKRILQYMNIAFPSSLAGCGFLLSFFLLVKTGSGGGVGPVLYQFLAPGAAVLARWLPVFFVPSLVMLPLSAGLGSSIEVLKVVTVIIGGFLFSLLSTSGAVIATQNIFSNKNDSNDDGGNDISVSSASPTSELKPKPKPFSPDTVKTLSVGAALTGILGNLALRTTMVPPILPPFLLSAHMLLTTLAAFVFGSNLPPSFVKICHPLVTCTSLTWIVAFLSSVLSSTGASFLSILSSYRTGTPYGAGDILLSLLGPSVLALSCQMYDRRKLVRDNLLGVGAAILTGSVGGLFGTAFLVRLLRMADPVLRLSLLSRNITSPLAMAIAGLVGADPSLAVTMVVVTGLFGANFGASILDAFGVQNAAARGLGIGAAAHGLGTAAFANEEDAFPFAAIAMALTASACTVLVSVPVVKNALLKIALG